MTLQKQKEASIKKTTLGIDLSPTRCGLALSDANGIVASALFTIQWSKKKYKKLLYQINDLVQQYNVDRIVIGLPVTFDGHLPKNRSYIKTFAHNLRQITNKEYFFQDESYSTQFSSGHLKNLSSWSSSRQAKDEVAAAYILQLFLNEE